ncbi:xanthine dehydrogenase family protein molybdopterin-binding subunit [Paenibacillus humicola]|uniref:xanthine dehydrogenase family protein molybdopterin-binding subunit n=1 Tax=Paenibacillus humicola TaxID=3110540 RepID=UPI00237BB6D6|nr:xanthine dehydrogenase family protein molybdopterin-binding subunit [Paenibacillus humicola]
METKRKSPLDFTSKLTGQTRYIHDMNLPGQLVAGIVRSPHAHARIVRLDVSRAKEVAGVKAVLTAADVPDFAYGPTRFKDWNIFARDRVLFVGDEVAAIAAESAEALERALALVEVEYEVLPAVFSASDALNDSAPLLHEETAQNRPMHIRIARGDFEEGKKKAHVVCGGHYETNRIYQGHLEPIAVLANWSEEEGLTLWAGSHIPYRARETYAAGLGLPEDRVRIVVPPIGGSFGAKYVLKVHMVAAVLTMETKRPVKIVLDRFEDMLTAHPRVPLSIDIEIGADKEGNFVYKDVVVHGDAGARIYWSPNVIATACSRPDNIYRFQSVRAEGHLCYTNNSPTTCMRGFGNAEMLFAVESVIDDVANALGMDPAELRLRNIVREGETTIHGYKLDTCQLEACIRKAKELSGWDRRDKLPPNRGLGMALANHVSGYSGIDLRFEGSTAVARLKSTGEIEIETGEIELGQGMTSTYAKIAAQALQIDESLVTVKSGDTSKHPFGIGTLASRATVIGGNAVLLASKQLAERVAALIKDQLGAEAVYADGAVEHGGKRYSLQDIAAWHRARHAGDELSVKATYRPDTELPDASFYGHPSPNYPFAAHVAEVEVDPETGRTKVVGYWAVHDSGTILNRTMAKSQVVGAVAQGIGWVLMEDLVVREGQVRNPSMMDYRMPGATDIPPVEIDFIEVPDPNGPLGAKSLGEVALDPVPGAIGNAIAHAARARGTLLPLSAEKVWRMMQDKA